MNKNKPSICGNPWAFWSSSINSKFLNNPKSKSPSHSYASSGFLITKGKNLLQSTTPTAPQTR